MQNLSIAIVKMMAPQNIALINMLSSKKLDEGPLAQYIWQSISLAVNMYVAQAMMM